MVVLRNRRASVLAALTSLALVAAMAGPAAAADDPTFEFDLPAGLACADLDLHVAGFGDGAPVTRTFDGRAGMVLSLAAGPGYALTFTNASTGATYSLPSNGAVNWTAAAADGSAQMRLMGHNVVILFPADGGPSTTLYAGRVVIDVAADGVWTVRAATGSATDICAALS